MKWNNFKVRKQVEVEKTTNKNQHQAFWQMELLVRRGITEVFSHESFELPRAFHDNSFMKPESHFIKMILTSHLERCTFDQNISRVHLTIASTLTSRFVHH